MPAELALSSRDMGGGLRQSTLSVPEMHCASCIRSLEKALLAVEGVEVARANLSMRTVVVNWRTESGQAPDLVGALADIGYSSHPPSSDLDGEDQVQSHLLRSLAVAGFCSMNIMLLSVSVWAGADVGTRQAFHLLSACLALPAVFYSGSSFYISAWRVLVHGRMNMDVPISAGVLLSFGLSIYDTFTNAPQAYFEAGTSLLFVLLAGRLLDHTMRRKAKSAVAGLARLMPHGANIVSDDGSVDYIPLANVRPGMRVLVTAGGRVPADGIVVDGRSELDGSLVTGESAWKPIDVGSEVRAGEINCGGPFMLMSSVAPENSLLSEMANMLAAAEDGRSRYRRLADRAASLYGPVVHSLSLLAFAGWLYASGDLHRALTIAIAVLVITCPCALGLAVPMVQVVLARRLFDRGVMATDGSAFERLVEIDTVVFDKTGTLTTGNPALLNPDQISERHLAIAGSMGRLSGHPLSKALWLAHTRAALKVVVFDDVREIAGYGLEASVGGDTYRLGRRDWAIGATSSRITNSGSSVALSKNGEPLTDFVFGETIRPGAAGLILALRSKRIDVQILSGDAQQPVASIARSVGIERFEFELLPGDKVRAITDLQSNGRRVLMVGDGINDVPSLRAAHVSMAPSSASDIGRSAADFVFLGNSLSVVFDALEATRVAAKLVKQNFGLAAVYNAVSLPLALAGFVTPLMAAIAMSTSSMLVVANALRLAAPAGKKARDQILGSSQLTEVRP